MIDRSHLVGFVTAMIRVGDGDLLDQDQILSDEICTPRDREAIRKLRDLLTPLIENFSYLDSQRFLSETSGKSAGYTEMYRRRCEDPVRRTEMRASFCEALSQIENDAVLDLLPEEAHQSILLARGLVTSTENPSSAEPDAAGQPATRSESK